MISYIFRVILLLAWQFAAQLSLGSSDKLKVAFCLTGQLARLELYSKVKNIFAPNVRAGNIVHVVIYLDNEIDNVKQTFWKFDYSDTPYRNHTAESLESEIHEMLKHMEIESEVKVWIKLSPPSQDKYQVVGHVIPVSDKIVHKQGSDVSGDKFPEGGIEHAADRFQNNMRWLGALRDCTKWVQRIEYEQQFFYDVLVRLREDTYAFGPWRFTAKYRNMLTSSGAAAYRGINDHNFAVGRLYADDLFRGITEDYYMNKTLSMEHWGNPEHRIYQIAASYNIPMQNNTVCEQPLLPLRGKNDENHWLAHVTYATKLLDECHAEETIRAGCTCPEKWLKILETAVVPIH
jgi:hypothetical protein